MNQRVPLLDIHLTQSYKTVKTTPQWLLRNRQKEQYEHRGELTPQIYCLPIEIKTIVAQRHSIG